MGFFKEFRNAGAMTEIRNNGLSDGSGIEVCEHCKYRVDEKRSSYMVCAQHRIHVGARQVCGSYAYGDPTYQMS